MPAPAVESIYPYKPNKIAIIAAAILFGIGAVIHVYQMIRFRAWYYLALVTGAISELSPDSMTSTVANTTDSDDSRLCIPLPLSAPPSRISAVHPPDALHSASAVPLCSNDLHDIRTNRRRAFPV